MDKIVRSINSFPVTQEKGLDDELSKEKLAHPYEVFNPGNFQEPLNLTKEDFWLTLKQTTPPDEEINRTQEIIKKKRFKERTRIIYVILENGCSTIS